MSEPKFPYSWDGVCGEYGTEIFFIAWAGNFKNIMVVCLINQPQVHVGKGSMKIFWEELLKLNVGHLWDTLPRLWKFLSWIEILSWLGIQGSGMRGTTEKSCQEFWENENMGIFQLEKIFFKAHKVFDYELQRIGVSKEIFYTDISHNCRGFYFMSQYDMMLQQLLELTYQLYSNATTTPRINGYNWKAVTAMLLINTFVMQLYYTSVEIKTVHSIDSWNGGVMMMNTGSILFSFGPKRVKQKESNIYNSKVGNYYYGHLRVIIEGTVVILISPTVATKPLHELDYQWNIQAVRSYTLRDVCYGIATFFPSAEFNKYH